MNNPFPYGMVYVNFPLYEFTINTSNFGRNRITSIENDMFAFMYLT